MTLEVGDQAATSGMTKSIYDVMSAVLAPDPESLSDPDLMAMQEGWKKLSYAIAKGVIDHLVEHMEIHDIQTEHTTQEGDTLIATQVGTGRVE